MKSKKMVLVIATAALFTGISTGAFANDKYNGEMGSNWQDHIQSTKTRAQVIEELKQARAQGMVVGGAEPFRREMPKATSNLSRAEVRAEAAQVVKNIHVDPSDIYFGS